MSAPQTIVALSSGRPPAAIAVVRVSGPDAVNVVRALAGRVPPARRASLTRLINPNSGDVLDDALTIIFPGPTSATGEDLVEFHCHGGRATIEAVIDAILSLEGLRLAEPGEFTRRALGNGRLDLTEAEGLADLLAAETELQRKSAMLRAGGALRREIESFRDAILALSARAEVAIDYADEDDGAEADDRLTPDIAALSQSMFALANAPRVEPLRNGIRVVIAGPPNAGKSSLINALSKSDRAIVTDLPGTTRDVIEVPLAIGGLPFLLIDTAGLRESDDVVESIGIERASAEVAAADLLLWMGNSSDLPPGDHVLLLRPKADLAAPGADHGGLPISSTTGQGLDALIGWLIDQAKKLLPGSGDLALDRRQHALLDQAIAALKRASVLADPVLMADELRVARTALDGITGRAGVEDLLDSLFGRFCLGK
nr:tRNA uridine-5-carboxymethylaminomethyl(34) synthesis GTPase MnmE [uncultured Sphingomonas sp.]